MNEDLETFLSQYKPLAEAWPVWGDGYIPLRERTYLSRYWPPDNYISSARTILFRGDEVMVITDHKQEPYVIPGGRREPDESVEAALNREVLEETGWTLAQTAVLGFVHFHHLSPKPDGYLYPYPDFVQVVFTAVADTYHPEAVEFDHYIASAQFRPLGEVLTLNLPGGQKVLLAAAMKQYEEMQ